MSRQAEDLTGLQEMAGLILRTRDSQTFDLFIKD
jgi:hypothetical protein